MQYSMNRLVRGLRVAGPLMVAGGFEVAKDSSPEVLKELTWLPSLVTAGRLVEFGVGLIVVGLIAFGLSFSIQFLREVAGVYRRVLMTFSRYTVDYRLRYMTPADFGVVYEEFRRIFGEEMIPPERVKEWMKKNPMIAYTVVRASRDHPDRYDLVGYFELLPLTKAGEEKLRRSRPDTGSLSVTDIYSPLKWAVATAYYVASVGVIDATNRKHENRRLVEGTVMRMLIEQLRCLGVRQTIDVYARPVTKDGLRLVREYGFRKRQTDLCDEKAIWCGTVNIESNATRMRKRPKPLTGMDGEPPTQQ